MAMTRPEARLIESHGFRCRRGRTGERRARRAAGHPSLSTEGSSPSHSRAQPSHPLSERLRAAGPRTRWQRRARRAPCPGSGRVGR